MIAGAVVAGAVVVAKKKHQEQQRRLAEQRRRDSRAASAAFDRLDVERRGALTREEARQLLQMVTGSPVRDEGLDMVFIPATVAAREAAEASASAALAASGVSVGFAIEPLATKEDLVRGISQYRAFLSRYAEVSSIISQHDKSRTGSLDRDELREAIIGAEAKTRAKNLQLGYDPPKEDAREVWGITMELTPTDGELDVIFHECDANADGKISCSELLPALAVWSQLAHERIEREKEQCCCGAGKACVLS